MKVCLLCFKSTEKSGSGMDVYAWNIVSHPKTGTQFITLCHDRKSYFEWVLKEFIVPVDALNLSKVNADIYHAVSPVGTKIAFFARKRPIISTVHDLIPNSLPEKKWYYKYNSKQRRWLNPWYWWFLKRSDYFIPRSESTKRDLIRLLKVPPKKISVIYYGTDLTGFSLLPRVDYHNPKKILYIGALDPGKGVCDLVEAFGLVAKRLHDVTLLIGGRGKALPELVKMVDRLGLKERIQFLGFVPPERLSYYYNCSDVFVFPSYLGFHLMLLDAMASGLPVIADNLLDAPEYIGDGGWLVEPGNIHQIAETIVKALTDSQNYALVSKKAVERVKLFSWERMARETINVYEKFLGENDNLNKVEQ